MEAIKYYVKGAFVGVAETPEVLEQQEELIADLTAKVDDLVSEGRSQDEALGTAIASMGDLSGLVKEFVAKEPADSDAPAAKPVRTVEAYVSKLRVHVVVISAGVAVATLFVLSVFAAVEGTLGGSSALLDLMIGVAGLGWIAQALHDFHARPEAVDTVPLGGTRLRTAVLQWAGVCAAALLINVALGSGRLWAWTVWVGGAAWPLSVFVEHRLLTTGRFVHPKVEVGSASSAADVSASATTESCV
ncbi:MAG: permease prefix domain 1-containing protein [Actinomycetota bacterium]|nr:permease prefix domain 1-containing protein [Actinomycetota bacterium]